MSWIDVTIWTIASVCTTLALMHVRIWWSDPTERANVSFALVAIGVALFGLCELGMIRAETTERFATVLRWAHVPIFMMVVGILSFVATYFRAGRPWLAHAAWTVNLLTLVVNFVRQPNADYEFISGIRQVNYLGVMASVADGQTSVWHWVGQASFLILLCFVADASLTLWRSGDRQLKRRAATIGGSIVVFVLISAGQAALVYGGIVQVPHLGAPFFFPVLLVMGYELSEEVLSAARLTHRLQVSEASLRESEQRMRLVASEAQQLSGRLINAQEDERRRIARELHDDLSQRLGVMSVQLDLLRRSSDDPASAPVIQRLASEVGALSSEIHALSYTLHPAKLDQLGLDSAARGWCRDLDAQSGLAFDFVSGDVPSDLSPDAALCLYRILQETTRNIVRHSGATAARVELSMEADGLHLTVEDPGRGFDLTRAGTSGGLGLVSMRERVRLLKGTLVIDSEPGRGTRVEAVVPIAASASERADSRAARGALHEPT